uniref:Sodium/potassium-transporting ATPase subunit alpha n=1 Tax=Zosterops lateralis melanops TaxID=1220523 RepID=A0A8D2PXX9_ZOSLA
MWVAAAICLIAYGVQEGEGDRGSSDNVSTPEIYLGTPVIHLSTPGTGMTHLGTPGYTWDTPGVHGGLWAVPICLIAYGVQEGEGDRGSSDNVDNSSLTGESEPQTRSPECTHESHLETRNIAFFSTMCLEGTATGLVISTGDRTVIGRIASLASGVGEEKTPIAVEIEHFVDIIAGLAVLFGGTFFTVALVIGYPFLRALVFFMAIVVAYVPEGLLATVTVCLSLTAKRLARRNCVVKNLEAVETLGSTSVICSDKTGTLTQNRMTVAHLWFDGQVHTADTTEDQYTWDTPDFDQSSESWTLLSQVITLCNRAQFKPGQDNVPVAQRDVIGDASESALLKFAEVTSGPVAAARGRFPKVAELPFNSTNKFQVRQVGQVRDRTFGDIGRHWSQWGHWGVWGHLGGFGENLGTLGTMGAMGTMRSLGTFGGIWDNFGWTQVPPQVCPAGDHGGRCVSPQVIMVTGDHPVTAKAIAAAVGIISEGSETPEDVAARLHLPLEQVDPRQARARVVTGSELAAMAPGTLQVYLRCISGVPRCAQVCHLCRQGSIVAVTGDGVNDSPALKKADIGVAMGIAGSDAAKNAADMILLDDNFASIVTGVEQGRLIFDNLKKSIAYTLTKNIPELAPYLIYITASVPLPLGCITILFIELCTDIFPSVSLAYERAESDIMHLRPRDPRRDRLVNEPLAAYSYFQIGVIQSFAGFVDYFVAMAQEGWWPGLVLGLRPRWEDEHEQELQDSYGQQWVSDTPGHTWDSPGGTKMRKNGNSQVCYRNRTLVIAIVFQVCIGCFLCYCPGMPNVFNFMFQWWLVPMPFGLLILVYDEIRKLGVRRHPGSE